MVHPGPMPDELITRVKHRASLGMEERQIEWGASADGQ